MLINATLPLVVAVFVTTALLALAWERVPLFQVANARSFHVGAIRTSGGISFVIPLAAALLWWFFQGAADALPLALAFLALALLGLIDDLRELSSVLRLSLHFVVVALLLRLTAAAPVIAHSEFATTALWICACVGLVWYLNLYNFMDGIDGIASLQAVGYALGCAFYVVGDGGWRIDALWALAAAGTAFLAFNWAPARMFMGDVGSGALGLLTGWFALALAHDGAVPFVVSLILLGSFWFDATYTLCVRMITGQRFFEGHRSHLYQRLAERLGHGRTSALYAGFMLLWLMPLAFWAGHSAEPVVAVAICGLACTPLLLGCVLLRAGRP
ncbi:MAG: glycosyl transferase [Pseudomonadota bacterium]